MKSHYRTKVLDCSAAENLNIREIFKSFLVLSKIQFGPKCGIGGSAEEGCGGLKPPTHQLMAGIASNSDGKDKIQH
jgi:hypothetical protein